MHIAICFFGLTRSLKYTIESIKQNIFEVLYSNGITYTKFLHTYDLDELTNKRSNENKCKLEKDEYKLLDCENVIITNQELFLKNLDFNTYKKNGDPWYDNYKSLQNLLCQLNSLNEVTKLWQENDKTYDLILYIRPDLKYNKLSVEDLIQSYQEKKVLTPSFHMGVCNENLNDRFAIGPPAYMMVYGSRLSFAKEYAEKQSLHSESFLKYVLNKNNIRYESTFTLMGKRVRANGNVQQADKNLF